MYVCAHLQWGEITKVTGQTVSNHFTNWISYASWRRQVAWHDRHKTVSVTKIQPVERICGCEAFFIRNRSKESQCSLSSANATQRLAFTLYILRQQISRSCHHKLIVFITQLYFKPTLYQFIRSIEISSALENQERSTHLSRKEFS